MTKSTRRTLAVKATQDAAQKTALYEIGQGAAGVEVVQLERGGWAVTAAKK